MEFISIRRITLKSADGQLSEIEIRPREASSSSFKDIDKIISVSELLERFKKVKHDHIKILYVQNSTKCGKEKYIAQGTFLEFEKAEMTVKGGKPPYFVVFYRKERISLRIDRFEKVDSSLDEDSDPSLDED